MQRTWRKFGRRAGEKSGSIHYVSSNESDGGTIIQQAWFNGAHDWIKVAVERTDASGRELTEYIPCGDPHLSGYGMFVLTRKFRLASLGLAD